MHTIVAWGPYFEHIKDGWSHRNDKNVLFLFYEDLIMDLEKSLKRLAAFLDYQLNDIDIPELVRHLSFENFKNNTAVNREHLSKNSTNKWEFVRRGKIGGNPEMTPILIAKIDEFTEKQLMGCGLNFPNVE